MKTYFIRTHGCQMNEHDSERIAGLLDASGYVPAASAEDADLVLFNTCAIRENADKRLYGELGALKALKDRRPDLQIAVGGCQVQKDKNLVIERAPWVDVAFGTFSVGELPALLAERARTGVAAVDFREQTEVFPSSLPARRGDPFHAWVALSVGCDNACTFCIVPAVRGPQVSRRPEAIMDEVEALVTSGVVEVSLLGQNVNTYGRDLGGPGTGGRVLFADLLRALDAVAGLRRIRFTSPHPHDFTPDVIDAMAGASAVCEHIHFPLQSGSDAILRAMRRSYRSARYLSLLAEMRAAIGGLAVTTDIIVGFPGETEADFQDTLRVVEEARFDSAYTFQYSPRPGTAAFALDPVPPEVVTERFGRLVELQERVSLERNTVLTGSTVEVLVEGPSRKDPARITARTRTNKIVHLAAVGRVAGEFLDARITGAHPHHLDGVVA